MDPAGVLFDRGLNAFGEVASHVDPGDWERPSPCEGWRAIDVLGHLGSSIEMGIRILHGERPTWSDVDRPGDLVDGDPVVYWETLTERAREALDNVDLDQEMESPMGVRTVADGLAFPTIDLYVHAWDVGEATGQRVEVPDDPTGPGQLIVTSNSSSWAKVSWVASAAPPPSASSAAFEG